MNEKIFCPNCGMENESGDMFCGNCGTRLEVQTNQSVPNTGATVGRAANSNEHENRSSQNIAVSQNYNNVNSMNNSQSSNSHATASLVLGIIAVICWFFGYSAVISVICGFIGVTLAGKAKEEGCESGTRTAGFVLSLIGLLGGAAILIACVACVGSVGMLGASL